MLTASQLATVRAALLFWEEEMATNPADFMRPFLDPRDMKPLSVAEVQELRERFDPQAVRYAAWNRGTDTLADLRPFSDSDDARQQPRPGNVVVTVLLPCSGF